jgi:L-lactate dehydrogenase (cytochrome)
VVKGIHDLDGFKAFIDSQFDPSVTWKDIDWIRERWSGKLVIKGVMCAEDARSACEAGADAVVVSNHGGRQLDGVASSISKLPEVVSAAAGRADILLDGGVRNGTDVVKAVALGAGGVLLGRAWAWALAARGEQGVRDLLTVFRNEISNSMALMGVNRIGELGPDNVETLGS